MSSSRHGEVSYRRTVTLSCRPQSNTVPVGAVRVDLRAVAVLLPAADALKLVSLVGGRVLLQHLTLGRHSVGLRKLGGGKQLVEPRVELPHLLRGQAADRLLYLTQLCHRRTPPEQPLNELVVAGRDLRAK